MSLFTLSYQPNHIRLDVNEAKEETRMSHTSLKTEPFLNGAGFCNEKTTYVAYTCPSAGS